MAGTSAHPITIEPAGVIVTVNSQGMTLAHSAAAQVLREFMRAYVAAAKEEDLEASPGPQALSVRGKQE